MNALSPESVAAAHLAAGRPAQALLAIESAARDPGASHTVLARYASVLKALERTDECLAIRRLAVERFPESGVAWHNLASLLGDLGAGDEASRACEKAFAAGLDAPETWYVYARALAGQSRLDDSMAALDQALRRRPAYPDALIQKAKLVWALTGDVDKAAAVFPDPAEFVLSITELYRNAGDHSRALDLVAAASRRSPADVNLLHVLAGLALEQSQDDLATMAVEASMRLAPHHPVTLQARATERLALGDAEAAYRAAVSLIQERPNDQAALALCAAAARVFGAPEYARLYDYPSFVRGYDIDPPPGWASVETFLADLKATLDGLHEGGVQPPEQTLRNGTQTSGDLRSVEAPALQGFFAAIDPLIRRYITDLGSGSDPLRARNSGGYAIASCWSNRLQSEGRHVDHIHPRGWLSSAFYVEVPSVVLTGNGKDGWIEFGRPGLRGATALEAAHFERPTPGRLVLFPSYMWHGTAPFTSPQTRTTIAFDIVPA